MDEHIENDKINAPFLLAASFSKLIQFKGSKIQNSVLYWRFTPKKEVEILLNQLRTKTEPHIPAKDLFEAIDTFWKQVTRARNEGNTHGSKTKD